MLSKNERFEAEKLALVLLQSSLNHGDLRLRDFELARKVLPKH
jgi:hypothetical protein